MVNAAGAAPVGLPGARESVGREDAGCAEPAGAGVLEAALGAGELAAPAAGGAGGTMAVCAAAGTVAAVAGLTLACSGVRAAGHERSAMKVPSTATTTRLTPIAKRTAFPARGGLVGAAWVAVTASLVANAVPRGNSTRIGTLLIGGGGAPAMRAIR